ncbi:hypothetical protein ES703_20753 [subsurface metagenome]
MGRRKFQIEDRVIGNNKKPAFGDDKKGAIVGILEYSQYQVRLDDGTIETVYSWWIDPLSEVK